MRENSPNLQSIFQENLYFLKRRELIQNIQDELSKELSKKVSIAAYIANTLNPNLASAASMSLAHIAHVDDLIRTASGDDVEATALVIESFGGDATFPSAVIERARKYCKEFYVIVVNVAKSAATLLSIISDKVIALETASFGPVDPQLIVTTPQGVPQVVSAREFKDLIEKTLPEYVKNLTPVEKAAILASQNYEIYQRAIDGINLVKEVIDTHLGPKFEQDQIKKIKAKLVDAPLSHGINVTCGDLYELGFSVISVKANSVLGRMLLEYHRRALRGLMMESPNGQGVILFESERVSFQVVAQVVQQASAQTLTRPSPAKPAQGGQGATSSSG